MPQAAHTARMSSSGPDVMRVVVITDRHLMAAQFGSVANALAACTRIPPHTWLLVRDKDASDADRQAIGAAVLAAHAGWSGRLWHGAALNASTWPRTHHWDGSHWPQAEPLPPPNAAHQRWGCSRHDVDGVWAAALARASYVQFGPVWATPSKAGMGAPLGLGAVTAARGALDRVHRAERGDQAAAPALAAAHARSRKPRPPTQLIAIGGIDGPQRAEDACAAGANGVAVIRAIWAAPDPNAALAALHRGVTAGLGRYALQHALF